MRSSVRHGAEHAVRFCFAAAAGIAVLSLLGIFLYLFFTGIRVFHGVDGRAFFSGEAWNPTSYRAATWNIFPLLFGTLLVTVIAAMIVIPVGISIAIYLSEFASSRVRNFLKPVIEMIAGIPSVVFGFIGIISLAPLIARIFGLSNGLNALTAALLVAAVALPTIASMSEDAISAVSHRLRESSYALGAGRWDTIRGVVLPAARSGIIAAVMLGIGRIIGETMIVLMVAGNSRAFPSSPLSPARPITAVIATEIKETVVGSLHWEGLFALGMLLFCLTFILNFAAERLAGETS